MTTKGLDFLETKLCPVCRKYFSVLYPHLWRYKVQTTSNRYKYFCSWKCLRADEKGVNDEMARMKKDGTPAKKPGPKKTVIEKDIDKIYEAEQEAQDAPPETLGEAMGAVMDTANKFMDFCDEVTGAKQETRYTFAPDGEHLQKITEPLKYDGFTVSAIRKDFGRYSRDTFNKTEYLDYESNDGDEISMPVEAWRRFLKELYSAARVLGVDLDEKSPS